MGVPGFFMWLMKQYKNKKMVFPKVNADENDIVHKIDYLLIDMNCMIHPECLNLSKIKNYMIVLEKNMGRKIQFIGIIVQLLLELIL